MSRSAHLVLGLLLRVFLLLVALASAASAQPGFILPEATRQLVVVTSRGWASDSATLQRWQAVGQTKCTRATSARTRKAEEARTPGGEA